MCEEKLNKQNKQRKKQTHIQTNQPINQTDKGASIVKIIEDRRLTDSKGSSNTDIF